MRHVGFASPFCHRYKFSDSAIKVFGNFRRKGSIIFMHADEGRDVANHYLHTIIFIGKLCFPPNHRYSM